MTEAATSLVGDTLPRLETRQLASENEATRFDESTPTIEGSNERYYLALESLHQKRRALLTMKRLGDPEYRQEHYDELRQYIDDFQHTLESLENRRVAPVVSQIETLARELIAGLNGRPAP